MRRRHSYIQWEPSLPILSLGGLQKSAAPMKWWQASSAELISTRIHRCDSLSAKIKEIKASATAPSPNRITLDFAGHFQVHRLSSRARLSHAAQSPPPPFPSSSLGITDNAYQLFLKIIQKCLQKSMNKIDFSYDFILLSQRSFFGNTA